MKFAYRLQVQCLYGRKAVAIPTTSIRIYFRPVFLCVGKLRYIVQLLQVVRYERIVIVIIMMMIQEESNAISQGCLLEQHTMGTVCAARGTKALILR